MPVVCKVCNGNLRKCYYCTACDNAFHLKCGKFKVKPTDLEADEDLICVECVNKPPYLGDPTLCDYDPAKSRSRSPNPVESQGSSQILKAIDDLRNDMNLNFAKLGKTTSNLTAEQAKQGVEINNLKEDFNSYKETQKPEFSVNGFDGDTKSIDGMREFVQKLGVHVHVQFTVEAIRRIAVRKDRSLLVTFYSFSLVQRLLDAKLKFRKIMYSDIVENSTSTKQIFINPIMSKASYQLLKKTKIWAKNVNWKFVWFSDGRILIRRAEGEKIIEIERNEQLDILRQKFSAQNPAVIIANK